MALDVVLDDDAEALARQLVSLGHHATVQQALTAALRLEADRAASRASFLTAVEESLAAADRGEVFTADELRAKVRDRFGAKASDPAAA